MNNNNTTPSHSEDITNKKWNEVSEKAMGAKHSEETETTQKHTPTPWRVNENVDAKTMVHCAESGVFITDTRSSYSLQEAESNAALIVTAVNQHSSLVRRVEEQKEEIEELTKDLRSLYRVHEISVKNENQLQLIAEDLQGKYAEANGKAIRLQSDNEAKDKRIQELESTLRKVANWELPTTGKFWDEKKKDSPMSYEAAYGSNGVRDYFKSLANEALTPKQ